MTNLHKEILDSRRFELLQKIIDIPDVKDFYLAGGTGLSLMTGYRESVDFDFFTDRSFNPEYLCSVLRNIDPNLESIKVAGGTCDVNMSGVQVSFFLYPYRVLQIEGNLPDIPNLRIASMDDIACMKLTAIGSRGAKKDFYDLYQIMQDKKYTASDLVTLMQRKYGSTENLLYIGIGLGYFEDADSQVLPQCFRKFDWKSMKRFFASLSNEFIRECEFRARALNCNIGYDR